MSRTWSERGLLCAAASSFFFSVTSLIAKTVGLPPLVLSWFGFLGLTALSIGPLVTTRWTFPWKYFPLIILRSVVGTLFLISSFDAVELIPIGDASVIFYTAPVFTVIFANVFLGEPYTLRSAVALVVIFVGVILVVQPPVLFSDHTVSEDYFTGVLVALAAALTEAASNIILRQLKSVHYSAVMFCHGVLSLTLTSFFVPFSALSDDFFGSTWTLVLSAGLAGFSALEQLMMTLALSVEHAGPVALVQATDIIFGYLYQIVFFGEEVKLISAFGAFIIAFVVYKLASESNQQPKPPSFCHTTWTIS